MSALWSDDRNLSLLTDFYEITMANGYFLSRMHERRAVFEYFFREIPDGGGFAITAGLQQVMEAVCNLRFTGSWSGWPVSHFGVTSARCRKVLPSFPGSR